MIKYRAGNQGKFGCLFEAVESAESANQSVWESLDDCGTPVEHRALEGQFLSLKGRECTCANCLKIFSSEAADSLGVCTA